MRSHGTREAASRTHHPWDQHFAHHKWPQDWHRFHGHFHHFPGVFWFWPFWDPFWYYGFHAPYFTRYIYCYDADPYDLAVYAPASTLVSAAAVESDMPPGPAAAESPADGEQFSALQLYSGAREAFRTGDYRDALRLANHAAIEAPQNPKVHELISLTLFALGDYRGAAIEAHAALAFGPPSDWPALAEHYADAAAYTKQLRALEAYTGEHKSAADAHFLSAYHYLMIGGREDAKTQMALAVKLTPKDPLAAHVLKQLESGAPVTPPKPEPPKPQPAK
jgi:tetratricopeptide (TPR) repeat protein